MNLSNTDSISALNRDFSANNLMTVSQQKAYLHTVIYIITKQLLIGISPEETSSSWAAVDVANLSLKETHQIWQEHIIH